MHRAKTFRLRLASVGLASVVCEPCKLGIKGLDLKMMSLDWLFSTPGQGRKNLPSVITSVASAAVLKEFTPMQENCFVGFQWAETGRQETITVSKHNPPLKVQSSYTSKQVPRSLSRQPRARANPRPTIGTRRSLGLRRFSYITTGR